MTDLKTKHIRISLGEHSTLALEEIFWHEIERLADKEGVSWKQWISTKLKAKPVGEGRASWIRCKAMEQVARNSQ